MDRASLFVAFLACRVSLGCGGASNLLDVGTSDGGDRAQDATTDVSTTEANDAIACPGATVCGARCADLLHDPANCGGCEVVCQATEVCGNGACSLGCAGGATQCGRSCVELESDPGNCGACGRNCGALRACVEGACVDLAGGADASMGSGADAGPDAAVGRDAGQPDGGCPAGQSTCQGVCVDTAIDSTNCGGCALPCAVGNVCTDGVCAPATSEWQMFGYNAQHTGDNTAETGIPPAIDSWSATIDGAGVSLSPATVENGRAFVTYSAAFTATQLLSAIDVSDGRALWTYNFGAVDSVGHPSVVNGTVYVQTNHGTTGDSYLWAIDAAAGTVTWAVVFGSQWEHFWAPLVVGSGVFIDGGEYGGMYGFSTADGSQIFFNSTLGQYDSYSPAYFGGDLYTFIAGDFSSENPSTGAVLSTTSLVWNWTGYSMNTAPVFGPAYGYVISPPNLIAIDPAKAEAVWTANGTFSGTPAVADGIVYGISAGDLIARDATTGSLLATMVGDGNLMYPPVVAAGYVYAASDANVYAWNLATHTQAWTAPVGGWLTVAARRLLVADASGELHGFVLSP